MNRYCLTCKVLYGKEIEMKNISHLFKHIWFHLKRSKKDAARGDLLFDFYKKEIKE